MIVNHIMYATNSSMMNTDPPHPEGVERDKEKEYDYVSPSTCPA